MISIRYEMDNTIDELVKNHGMSRDDAKALCMTNIQLFVMLYAVEKYVLKTACSGVEVDEWSYYAIAAALVEYRDFMAEIEAVK